MEFADECRSEDVARLAATNTLASQNLPSLQLD